MTTLKQAMAALNLTWESNPLTAAKTISENYDLGKKSTAVYSNPNETAIAYVMMWEQSHGYASEDLKAYENTPITEMARAYFG